MKNTLFLIMIITLSSCGKQIDRADINSVAKHAMEHLVEKNSDAIKRLRNYEEEELDTFGRLAYLANNMELEEDLFGAKNIKPIKYEIKKNNIKVEGRTLRSSIIYFYLEADNDLFQVKAITNRDKEELYFASFDVSNITLDCKEYKESDYRPLSLIMDKAYWLVSNDRKYFKEFNLRGKNRSDYKVEEISFRIRLEKTNGREFISKTIKRKINIEQGDTFEININELDNYFAGFSLSKNTFSFTTELISVLPKPIDRSCELIERLKT